MATSKGEVYKCEACGNVVEVKQGGGGDLVCCGENMKLLNAEEAKQYG
ncbi:desulfoferrodoxin FeS4 iron-binding domain-containing protein [Desulfohalovibrio reitneri]